MPRPMTPLREAKVRNETLIRMLHAHTKIARSSEATMLEEDALRLLRTQRATLNRITEAGKEP
jgi:hypothetical protein